MKKTILSIATICFFVLAGCSNNEVLPSTLYTIVDDSDYLDAAVIIEDIAESELSENEINGLLQMREEEKLARDVYITLYETWGLNIFINISESEQTHTDAVKFLLERYNIEDPVKSDVVGVFTDTHIQELYDSLTEQGNASVVDALTVGAIIEDLDIFDLQELVKSTDNEDILAVYDNLSRGSRNHMRSFIKNLNGYGETYTAQFISEEDYASILESGTEKGKN